MSSGSASRKAQLPIVAMPQGSASPAEASRPRPWPRRSTDAEGRFEVAADFDPERYLPRGRIRGEPGRRVPRRGPALAARIKDDATEVTLRLAPQVPIRGRLLTPGGMPAPGVRVTLEGFHDGQISEGMGVGSTPTDDEIPSYWPRPRTTDADGRFTIEGVPEGTYAQLDFQHPDYAVDEVTVNAVTRGGIKAMLSAWTKGFEITPVKPTFTHTLEPARPVQGRVTDKATGKPLAGLLVEMIPMRRHGGMPFYTRTDADGRYRVSGHQADRATSPPSTLPPIPVTWPPRTGNTGWPAGAKFLEKNFALTKGRIVHGQVIDAETKRPIAGAAVVYQPKRGNPNNNGDYDLRNPVVTDAEGRFAITALPGPGILAVETPDENYMRVAVEADVPGGRAFPQGVASIDVPKDGEPPAGRDPRAQGCHPRGAGDRPGWQAGRAVSSGPARGSTPSCIDVWNQGQPFADGVFRLPGADPGADLSRLLPPARSQARRRRRPQARSPGRRSRSRSGSSRRPRSTARSSPRAARRCRADRSIPRS